MTKNKFLGLILFIISTLMGLMLIGMLITSFTNPDFRGEWFSSSIFGLIIFFAFTWFLFQYGRRLYNKDKTQLTKQEEGQVELDIHLKIKFESAEFIKLSYIETYSNPIVLLLTLSGLSGIFVLPETISKWLNSTDNFPFTLILFIFFVIFFLPLSIYFQSKKKLSSSKFISESILYHFDNENIEVVGESFNTSMKWTMIYSVKELKDWFIIYTDKRSGLLIPKNRFQSKEEESNFKSFLIGLKGIKKALKE